MFENTWQHFLKTALFYPPPWWLQFCISDWMLMSIFRQVLHSKQMKPYSEYVRVLLCMNLSSNIYCHHFNTVARADLSFID